MEKINNVDVAIISIKDYNELRDFKYEIERDCTIHFYRRDPYQSPTNLISTDDTLRMVIEENNAQHVNIIELQKSLNDANNELRSIKNNILTIENLEANLAKLKIEYNELNRKNFIQHNELFNETLNTYKKMSLWEFMKWRRAK